MAGRTSRSVPPSCDWKGLNLQCRIERITAGQRCLRQYPAGKSDQRVRPCKVADDRQARHFDRVQREHVAMDKRVVPRRTWPVVAVVIAAHVLVRGKPSRVVVESLPGAALRGGTWLAARCDALGKFAPGDGQRIRRQVDQ